MTEKDLNFILSKVSFKFHCANFKYSKDLEILNCLRSEVRIYILESGLIQFERLFQKCLKQCTTSNSNEFLLRKFFMLWVFSTRNMVLQSKSIKITRTQDIRNFLWLVKGLELEQSRNLNLFIYIYSMNIQVDHLFKYRKLLSYILETLLLRTTNILTHMIFFETIEDQTFLNHVLKDSLLVKKKFDFIKNQLYIAAYFNLLFHQSKYVYYDIYPLIFTRQSKIVKKFFYSSNPTRNNPLCRLQYIGIYTLELLESILYTLGIEN
jgi:hypothetical protein